MKTFKEIVSLLTEELGRNDIEHHANLIKKHASSVGWDIDDTKRSGLSGSRYIHVNRKIGEHPEQGDEYETKKIRVSNHALPPKYKFEHGEADFEASPDKGEHQDTNGDWVEAINYLSKRSGIVPSGVVKRELGKREEARKLRDKIEKEEKEKSDQARDRAFPIKREHLSKFKDFIDSVHPDSAISVSKNTGNITANHETGDRYFGNKPHEYSKSFDTVPLARQFISSKEKQYK